MLTNKVLSNYSIKDLLESLQRSNRAIAIVTLAGFILSACQADQPDSATTTKVDNPAAEINIDDVYEERQLLWGDTHVHSNLSFDAFSFGNKFLTSADSFAFARGDKITSSIGLEAQLKTPLDFLLVSDHAEFMGVMRALSADDPQIQAAEFAERWKKAMSEDNMGSVIDEFMATMVAQGGDGVPSQFKQDIWAHVNDVAEQFNDPGNFTAFIGYEWTSSVNGKNRHRNILFRDGPEKTLSFTPFSSIDNKDPEALWSILEDWVDETGGQVMSIPHNSNLSDGQEFSEIRGNGLPIDALYAQRRNRWEPLIEVTQVKGDSETQPLLSPDDKFADFESWDETDIGHNPLDPNTLFESYSRSYARPALQRGLKFEQELGTNPFKFGMIGSTDSHTGLATADSDNFFGKFLGSEPSVERLSNKMGGVLWNNRDLAASGYAAVWATANTRESIFDALARREVYATTGPRIAVRFFGSWDYDEELLDDPDMIENAYAQGVSMGGDLTKQINSPKSPSFIVSAMKDPEGANLDRIQIVKGWINKDGSRSEKVFNVAWSDNRTMDDNTGDIPDLSSTVDAAEATYTNTVGSTELSALWTDPSFDANNPAVYYVRVLEIETPRWTTYDAARFGVDLPKDVPTAVKERAYTSPIWYTP